MIIAIDGPAASGKGTIARRVAAHYGLRHLDTGLIYRAVGKAVLDAGVPLDDEAEAASRARALDPARFADPALKSQEVARAASIVSAFPKVREALLDFQRRFAATPPGAVLDGRDIGTVICPEAEVKLFVTASAQVRAHRRWLEVGGDEAQVLAEVIERDKRDADRAVSPLKAAEDALVLDTSAMTIDAAVAAAVAEVRRRLAKE